MKRFAVVFLLAGLGIGLLSSRALLQQPGANTLYIFPGGTLKDVTTRLKDTGQLFTESISFKHLQNAAIQKTVPGGLTDGFLVELSARCALYGAGDLDDRLQVQVRISSGGPETPIPPGTVTLCSDNHTASSQARFATDRLPAGTYLFKVYLRALDHGNNDNLSGFIENWSFQVITAD